MSIDRLAMTRRHFFNRSSTGIGITALASLLDEPVGELTTRLLGPVRRLVADGLLRR